LIGRTPSELGSSWEADGVERACWTLCPRLTASLRCDEPAVLPVLEEEPTGLLACTDAPSVVEAFLAALTCAGAAPTSALLGVGVAWAGVALAALATVEL
jgi:hypothetical protein